MTNRSAATCAYLLMMNSDHNIKLQCFANLWCAPEEETWAGFHFNRKEKVASHFSMFLLFSPLGSGLVLFVCAPVIIAGYLQRSGVEPSIRINWIRL